MKAAEILRDAWPLSLCAAIAFGGVIFRVATGRPLSLPVMIAFATACPLAAGFTWWWGRRQLRNTR